MITDIKKLHFKIRKLVDSLFIGNYKTAFKGRGLEFSDYRSYDENDDAKYIDFLASSREGKLLVKRYEEQREASVFFLLDVSDTMEFGEEKTKIDTLLETFYLLAFSAIKNNDKIGCIVFHEESFELIKPAKGLKHLHHIIQKILTKSFSYKKEVLVENILQYFYTLNIKNSLVFFLTDKMGDGISEKILKVSALKNDFIYVNIFDHFENYLDESESITRLGNGIYTFFLNLRNKNKIQEYKNLRAKKIHDFATRLRKYQMSYLYIDNTSCIFSVFFNFFRNR